jgi:6-pyruvoyltetrahydropterin/6-carboxytetrahydropterin synthase
MPLTIVKRFEFGAAHRLPNYKGPCQNLHGHNWTLEVGVTGPVDRITGMIADFKQLKDLVNDHIISLVDHQCLNEAGIPGVSPNPTAENMVQWMVQVLTHYLKKTGCELALIRLWETSTSYAEWRP